MLTNVSDSMSAVQTKKPPYRSSWPAFRTPLPVFLAVMLPVNGLMFFLLISRTESWQKWSAAALHLISLYAFIRGYMTRLVINDEGVKLRRLLSSVFIPWSEIRTIGQYVPGGGLGATEYVFATRRTGAPADKWEVNDESIQVQAQGGLLESLKEAAQKFGDANIDIVE